MYNREGTSRRLRPWALALAALVVLCGVFLAGYEASKHALIWQVRTNVADWFRRDDVAEVEWSRQSTNYHTLEIARLRLQRAYMLEEVGGYLLFSSRFGQLGYLSGDRAISLGPNVPLGLEALRNGGYLSNEAFQVELIRVTDLLAVQTAEGAYDLYAAHVLVDDDCLRMAIHKIEIAVSEGLTANANGWRLVYATETCVPLAAHAAPLGTGGRLVQYEANSLLFSIGDFDRVEEMLSLYADSELAKIMEVPLDGGAARVFARGFRNPQGLYLSRRGVIWETEHGPRGGDELNVINRGDDYGWPHVSLGLEYVSRQTRWRYNPDFASHNGYTPPRFAWSPSIGVSNLIEPDPRQFPHWDNHLLVASLRANSLRLLRLEGDEILFDEPIRFEGDRIRDVISLADGRIAYATDAGDLVLLHNAALNDRSHEIASVRLDLLDSLLPEHELVGSEVRWGAMVFLSQCSQCHSLAGEPSVGPPLDGIVGRRVGAREDYDYSDAIEISGARWTQARLRDFLRDPEGMYPGTRMPASSLTDYDLENLLQYLARSRPERGDRSSRH
jgi:cytochrome c2